MIRFPALPEFPRLKLPTLFQKVPRHQSPPVAHAPGVTPVYMPVPAQRRTGSGLWVGHDDLGGKFYIHPEDYVKDGHRDAVFAASGMGKSYLTGVLVEEMLDTGAVVVIMDPEGEYHTLAERYPILILGGDKSNSRFDLGSATPENFQRLSKVILKEGVSVIIDLSSRPRQEQQTIFIYAVDSLFSAMDCADLRRPIKLVVEEARIFAPQNGTKGLVELEGKTSLSVLQDVFTRGRKRGCHGLTATQRPAGLSKDISSQCNRYWFGGVKDSRDCNALKPYLDEAGVTPEEIRALHPGEFYFYGNGQTVKIRVKERKCRHGGGTPEETADKPRASKKRVQEIIAEGF